MTGKKLIRPRANNKYVILASIGECYEIVFRKCSSICAGINNAYTDDIKCAKQKENLGKPTRLKPVFLTDPGRTVYDLHKQRSTKNVHPSHSSDGSKSLLSDLLR